MEYAALAQLRYKLDATRWLLFHLCMMLVFLPAHACDITVTEISVGPRLLSTELLEYSSNGKNLVDEKGSLPGTESNVSVICDRWIFGLYANSDIGDRAYSGQTSFGVPLRTSSRIGESTMGASLYRQIAESLHIGLSILQRHTTRDIQSTPAATGYPESYERLIAKVGTNWEIPTSFGRWTLIGAVSAFGDQRMSLFLPGRDRTSLTFDEVKQWELGVQWRKNLDNNVFVVAAYRHIQTEISQSKYSVVTTNNIPVGIAYQPKTILIEQPLTLSIGMIF